MGTKVHPPTWRDPLRYPEPFEAIWEKVKPLTMTSRNRGFALYEAVNHVIDNGIPGAFVECGVWRGGSSMIIALALLDRDITNRSLYLFDTFEGMTTPSAEDRDFSGRAAADILAREAPDGLTHAACDLKTVRAHMISTGYPRARRAVDMFLEREKAAGRTHFLNPLDYTGRLFVKPLPATPNAATSSTDIVRHDYISEGLRDPELMSKFHFLEQTNPMPVKWPYLRRDVAHIWRTDKRAAKANIGVLSADEGAVLYNAALPFKGKRGLEIGCHMAFSTAHLLKAGLDLDVIDPALGDPAHLAAVLNNLAGAVPNSEPRLHAGFSPGIVGLAHTARRRIKWSFAFIDGLHDGTAPLDDARAVAPFMADTAAVMFHDLACPYVAQGLQYYSDAGWQTKIYETMQVMGIAWQGDYIPPSHIPDSGTQTTGLNHLAGWQKRA